NSFYYSAALSSNPAGGVTTVRPQGTTGDFIGTLGTSNPNISGSLHANWGGGLGNFAMLAGALPPDSTAAPSTADLASICTKQTDIQSYAKTLTTGGQTNKVQSLYGLDDLGIWGDSSSATITGYITNSDGSHATLNVVSTTLGSLALATGTQTANLTGVGLPVATPATLTLGTTALSSYALLSPANTLAALGSSSSPISFTVSA